MACDVIVASAPSLEFPTHTHTYIDVERHTHTCREAHIHTHLRVDLGSLKPCPKMADDWKAGVCIDICLKKKGEYQKALSRNIATCSLSI